MKISLLNASAIILIAFCTISFTKNPNAGLGIFSGQTDLGNVVIHKGSASYDAKSKTYTIEGSGSNIWATADGFHYVWRKMRGNFKLSTSAAFIGKGVEDHRKIGWMVRASLDSNSAHASAVVHGDGLTSLQFRKATGVATEEKRSTLVAANLIQLERKGNSYIMTVSKDGGPLITDQVDNIKLGNEVYVGLFVCSHNVNVSEKAVFEQVSIVATK